LLASPSV
jgi:hypothetical protein